MLNTAFNVEVEPSTIVRCGAVMRSDHFIQLAHAAAISWKSAPDWLKQAVKAGLYADIEDTTFLADTTIDRHKLRVGENPHAFWHTATFAPLEVAAGDLIRFEHSIVLTVPD